MSDFENFEHHLNKLKMAIFKSLYIPQIAEWLNEKLKKYFP